MSSSEGKNQSQQMPRTAWLYLIVIQLAGLAVLGWGIYQALQQADHRWLYLVLLTALASLFSTKLSSSEERSGSVAVTAGDFFIFTAIVLLGPVAAALMGAVEGLVSSWKLGVRRLHKLLFNVAEVALAAYLTGWFYAFLEPLRAQSNLGGLLASVLLSAVLYFLLNSLLLATAMALASGQPIGQTARRGFLWALPANCVNGCLVAIALALTNPLDLWLAAALVPLIIAVYVLRGVHRTEEPEAEGRGFFSGSFFEAALPMKARGYLYGVLVLALPILLYCLHYSLTAPRLNWLYLAVLAAVSSLFPLRLLAVRENMWLTLSDIFVFVALFEFGPEIATVIAAVQAGVFSLRRRPPGAYRWVFNVTHLVITAFVVGHLFRLLESVAGLSQPGQFGVLHVLLALATPMVCGFFYFALTLGLTSAAMSLATGGEFRQLWVTNAGWCYTSVLGALGGALAYLLIQSVPLGL